MIMKRSFRILAAGGLAACLVLACQLHADNYTVWYKDTGSTEWKKKDFPDQIKAEDYVKQNLSKDESITDARIRRARVVDAPPPDQVPQLQPGQTLKSLDEYIDDIRRRQAAEKQGVDPKQIKIQSIDEIVAEAARKREQQEALQKALEEKKRQLDKARQDLLGMQNQLMPTYSGLEQEKKALAAKEGQIKADIARLQQQAARLRDQADDLSLGDYCPNGTTDPSQCNHPDAIRAWRQDQAALRDQAAALEAQAATRQDQLQAVKDNLRDQMRAYDEQFRPHNQQRDNYSTAIGGFQKEVDNAKQQAKEAEELRNRIQQAIQERNNVIQKH
jgi:septal ring factor EnvC (AmiA/AmiB activator)